MTSVLFQGSEKLISTGAMDGKIKIWDLRKTYTNLKQDPVSYHTFPYPGQGVRKHGMLYVCIQTKCLSLFCNTKWLGLFLLSLWMEC